ncbi:MAG: redoxin domain-containing protein [Bacteroidota bacterium]
MKRFFTLAILSCFGATVLFAQPDFTFTDTHGDEHNLADAHEQGYIVLIDFFFVNCPPCQDTAPELASISEDYAGKNVIIWSLSDRDGNAAIEGFEEQFGFDFPAGGTEGGGPAVIDAYAADYNFTGFPTFSVSCPNGDFTWDIWPITSGAAELRNAIDACGVVDANPYEPLNSTSVEGIASLEAVTLAPNPTSTTSRLQLNLAAATHLNIQLVNAQGALLRTVFDGEVATGSTTLDVDVANLPVGAYWVRIQNAAGDTTTMPLQKG